MKEDNCVENICLQVLSKASASTTHEIKNTLSIINENAGFLEDLNTIAQGGDDYISPIQVQQATDAIIKQVKRSNTIMNNLNRFVHELDTLVKQTNLTEPLSLMAELTARQAAMKFITVSITCPSDCEIKTCMFHFEALIYLILCGLYECVQDSTDLEIRVIENSLEISIFFIIQESREPLLQKIIDEEKVAALAKQIKSSLSCEEGRVKICLPTDIESA